VSAIAINVMLSTPPRGHGHELRCGGAVADPGSGRRSVKTERRMRQSGGDCTGLAS